MKGRSRQKNKDPNEPVRPPKPYIRYSRTVWEKIASDNPGMNIGQIGNAVGKMWRNLPDDDKEIFNHQYQKDMIKYEEEIRNYHNSPTYQEWLRKSDEQPVRQREKEVTKIDLNQIAKVTTERETWPDHSFIQAELDSDEDMDYFDIRVECAERFYRNHALMHEIYSDFHVPSDETTTSTSMNSDDNETAELTSSIGVVEQQIQQMHQNYGQRVRWICDRNEHFMRLLHEQDERLNKLMKSSLPAAAE